MPAFDVDALRAEFPALAREQDGRPVAFLDGPGGTQVPQRVIDAVVGYYRDMNANAGRRLHDERARATRWSTRRTRRSPTSSAPRRPDEIKFGHNMSTLTLHIGRSHRGDARAAATRSSSRRSTTRRTSRTWKAMAADRGVTVRPGRHPPDDVTLDLEDLESKLGPRTKLVAVGYASNAVGTINPVREIVARAHEVGALTYVDAVAYAPHGPIDVRALDTDFLVCSAYKWFGPHLGALYGKAEVFDRLPAFKVRPAHDRFETGTASRSSRSPGRLAATDYLRDVGRSYGDVAGAPGAADASERRRELVAGDGRDRRLRARPRHAGSSTASRRIPRRHDPRHHRPGAVRASASRPCRSPSTASTRARRPRRSGATGIYVWDGDFYATGLIERLGKAETGGVLRIGLVHYNTADEVDRTLEAIEAHRRAHDRRRPDGRRSRRGWPAGSTRPSCAASSGCGSATRSPRTAATSTG